MLPIILLLLYNILFFYKFYSNPFKMCTSELTSTFFPFWRWSKGRIIFKSDMYYPYPACIPFLSIFYPPNIVTSYIASFIKSIDNQFKLFSLCILLHFLFGSILAYYALLTYGVIIALFGSISLMYSAYFVKPFTPCAIYTHAWVVGALSGGKIGAICTGMAILGGYWPTLVYILPVLLVLHPSNTLGLLIGLPQIIPFLWYWPKSVRAGVKSDPNIGKVPLWRYLDLILPNRTQNTINGIFWPEMAIYMGLVPILVLFFHLRSIWLTPCLLSFLITIQRIPARSLYLFSFSLIMLALQAKITWPILILQAWLLLENNRIYPHFPFSQWWKKPSEHDYDNENRWPGLTGYISGKKTRYAGAFALRD